MLKGKQFLAPSRCCEIQPLRRRTYGSLLINGKKQTELIEGIEHEN
jgi:hypothetical protein